MRSCMHSVKTTTTKNKQKEIHQPTNATLQSYSLWPLFVVILTAMIPNAHKYSTTSETKEIPL